MKENFSDLLTNSQESVLDKVIDSYSLTVLKIPVSLECLATAWGVTSIEKHSVESDAMLLASAEGYKIILKNGVNLYRQRFSLAHELGHLLLKKVRVFQPTSLRVGPRVFTRRHR